MGAEDEFSISKHNRREVQDSEKIREIVHPTVFHTHTPTRKEVQRRAHNLEREAVRKRNP